MNRTVFVLHCLLSLACANTCAAADEQKKPQLSDYAWGFPIATSGEASFYSIELPLAVNQSASDSALRDAGVFNAGGAPVMRVFRTRGADIDETEHLEPLPTLPVLQDSERSADDVRLLFERDGDKTRVEFNTDGLAPPKEDARLVAYIVDTRPLKESIEALDFWWNPIDSGFIGRIIVDASNNLQDWREVGSGAVADLRQKQASVVQRRVNVAKTSHDYLRIRWEGLPDQWSLSRIQGYYVTGVTRLVRNVTTLEAGARDPQDGGQIFDLGGSPLVDRLRVVLAEPNTVISATIHYWSDTQQRWVRIASGSHYHIGRGNTVITSDAIRINKIRASRFKVVVTGGQQDASMRLEIGWRPDSLIFLAQGEAPYTLAVGRAADALDDFPQHRLYSDRSIIGLSQAKGQTADAFIGSRYALGGADKLQIEKTVNWRQWSLWIGLLLGVAFVGFMATNVIRDLKTR